MERAGGGDGRSALIRKIDVVDPEGTLKTFKPLWIKRGGGLLEFLILGFVSSDYGGIGCELASVGWER